MTCTTHHICDCKAEKLKKAEELIAKLKEDLTWYAHQGDGLYSQARLYLKAQNALKEIQEFEKL